MLELRAPSAFRVWCAARATNVRLPYGAVENVTEKSVDSDPVATAPSLRTSRRTFATHLCTLECTPEASVDSSVLGGPLPQGNHGAEPRPRNLHPESMQHLLAAALAQLTHVEVELLALKQVAVAAAALAGPRADASQNTTTAESKQAAGQKAARFRLTRCAATRHLSRGQPTTVQPTYDMNWSKNCGLVFLSFSRAWILRTRRLLFPERLTSAALPLASFLPSSTP
jgi:hypothetical protein